MKYQSTFISRFLSGLSVSSLFIALAAVQPALAQEYEGDQPADEDDYEEVLEEVKVTGFRSSLQMAVALKRDAVNSRDSIVSEDMGKMPDLNLAEAIQRVPGVAIAREGGEGRNISLRGLGTQFTRVTLNGMEVPSSVGGLDSSGGVNRGRTFDFNVFSAELFNRIDINKSSTASIEEGGIAGTVELYTTRPLDIPGFHSTVSAQLGYNDLSEKTDPRLTATIGNSNKDKTFGWLLTAAYTERTVYQDGFGTVRWAKPDRDFADNNILDGVDLREVWFPRLPRQDSFRHNQDRLGLSGALQFRPNDDLEFGFNWVYSKFNADVDAYNSFAQFRRNAGWGYPAITPNSVTLDSNGDYAIAGNFDGVGLRTESRQQADTTKFDQYTGDFKYTINDSWTLAGMIGRAESKFEEDYFRVNIESPTATNFSYDFSRDPNVAAIEYNIDITDPANYFIMTNDRIRQYGVDRKNDTARLDLDWVVNDRNTLRFGAIYNDREVDSTQSECSSCTDQTDISGLGKVFTYSDIGGFGSSTELDFWVLDFKKAIAAYGVGDYSLSAGPGVATWTVTEKTMGAYVDYDWDAELAGRPLRTNIGVRFVQTDLKAVGYLNASTPIVEKNDYDNWLPSLNVAWDATDDLVLRGSLSRTMTRAGLSSLAPSKAYGDVNFTVSGGNSQLDPLEADSIDLAAEWYFAEDSVLAFAWFHKDIKSFISSPSTEEPLRPVDRINVANIYPTQPELLDPSLIWTYSSPTNTDGTKLQGFELAYQQAFTSLPGFWGNFGFLGNYSYVDAETEVIRSGQSVTVPLEGMSQHSWNATLYYETDVWGARVAVNNRDDYITDNTGSNGNVAHGTTGPTHVDLSAFWHINDRFTLTFEGINLTDESERLFTTGDGTLDLVREYNNTGRQYYLGVRVRF